MWHKNGGLSRPNSKILEKQEMFAVINRMINISYNFPQNKKIDICRQCGQEETMGV